MRPLTDVFDSLSSEGAELTLAGRFDEALVAFERARDVARLEGSPERIDRADLNIAMVWLQQNQAQRAEAGLRAILLRSGDDRARFSAAYNLASSLRKQGRLDQALRYARRAEERATDLGPDFAAPVHNLLGNILLGQNLLDDALDAYRRALAIRLAQDGDTRFSRALLAENIGYCLILRKDITEGIGWIRGALELAEQVSDRRCVAECLQDLCYALLLGDRHAEALESGERALVLATAGNFPDIEENCHYLLGELGSRTSDAALRDRHFQALQAAHPEIPFLHEFLCAVDVTGILTLKR